MKKTIIFLCLMFLAINANATTYYVREDGAAYGTTSTTCNGLYDAAYVTDSGPNCAAIHPAWILGAGSSADGFVSGVMSSGDMLVIADGSYEIGYGMPNTGSKCNTAYTYDCRLGTPPNGTSGNPTTIVGCSTTGCGSNDLPELWGTGRTARLMMLTGASYMLFKDIEMTDHWGGVNECSAGTPLQTCAKAAFSAYGGWHDLTFDGMDIHGFTYGGFAKFGGDGSSSVDVNFLVKNSNIDGNLWTGIDMDDCERQDTVCGVNGSMTFENTNMRWNGCMEAYPVTWGPDGEDGVVGRLPTAQACREANSTPAGYGDMIGTAGTGGDWSFTDCNLSHNTSDAIDLLHFSSAYDDGSVTVKRCLFEGNNGQAIKAPAPWIEDNIILGSCDFWGVSAVDYTASGFSPCRAQGTPLSLSFVEGSATIINNTISCSADNMITAEGDDCVINMYNNVLVGGYQYNQDACAMIDYYDTSGSVSCTSSKTINEDYNICWKEWKSGYSHCSNTNDQENTDPDFTGTIYNGDANYSTTGFFTGTNYYTNFYLETTSTAKAAADKTVTGADKWDWNSFDRGTTWDMGALEFGTTTTEVSCSTTASYCDNQTDCENADWYWYDATCNTEAEPAVGTSTSTATGVTFTGVTFN